MGDNTVEEKTEQFRRELDGWFTGDGEAVPFWERANIRAKELKELQFRMQVLEAQVKQLEGENEAQEAMIGELFEGLGFHDWEYSPNGARDAIRKVSDLVDGRISPEEFGRHGDGPEALPDHIMWLIDRQWAWHKASEEHPDPDIEVLAYNVEKDLYFIAWWDEGWKVSYPRHQVDFWCDPIPPTLEK